VEAILDDLFLLPLMIAYSGFVDENVQKLAKDAGFSLIIEAPVSQ
jgi:hypothetical protein